MMSLLVFLLRVFVVLGTIALVAFGALFGFSGSLDTYFAQSGIEQLAAEGSAMRVVRAIIVGLVGLVAATLSFGVLAAILDIRDKLVQIRDALTTEPAWRSEGASPMKWEKP